MECRQSHCSETITVYSRHIQTEQPNDTLHDSVRFVKIEMCYINITGSLCVVHSHIFKPSSRRPQRVGACVWFSLKRAAALFRSFLKHFGQRTKLSSSQKIHYAAVSSVSQNLHFLFYYQLKCKHSTQYEQTTMQARNVGLACLFFLVWKSWIDVSLITPHIWINPSFFFVRFPFLQQSCYTFTCVVFPPVNAHTTIFHNLRVL